MILAEMDMSILKGKSVPRTFSIKTIDPYTYFLNIFVISSVHHDSISRMEWKKTWCCSLKIFGYIAYAHIVVEENEKII